MNKFQFLKLKGGDILQFPSGAIRTVIEGPWDKVKKLRGLCITLAKMNRSRYRRASTVYFWPDVSRAGTSKVRVIGRTRNVMLKAELVRLREIGFNPREEILREARDRIDSDRRMGREVCAKALKLARISA